ncbi:protein Mpv17-like isoform X2 [Stegodyphus dumicola]|uniref:protein Mpv17-like isoform X2 n=1 Tax=Stegodyphus dumicola TaxID=202533 RepID=UPI0015AC6B1A|nr:protein Mpv17-like isoform X2 [Stegodyphus dumicola]
MTALIKWYSRILSIHPWKTQLCTTGFLMGSSDLIAQTAIEKCELKGIEISRVARFAFLGACFVGPVLRVWYNVLEKGIGTIGRTAGLKKMLIDQSIFSPCFIGCFLTVSGLLQLQPWHKIGEKIKKLWPAAQLITFYVIPLELRIVFVSCVALVWNTFLACQANKNMSTN